MNKYMDIKLIELIKSNRDLYENEPSLFFESIIEPALEYNNMQNKALDAKVECLEQRIKLIEGVLKDIDWGYQGNTNHKNNLSAEVIKVITKANELKESDLILVNSNDVTRHEEFNKKQKVIKELLRKTGDGLNIRYSRIG